MSDYQRWIRRVIKFAEKAGWSVHQNGHFKFKSPQGVTVVCSFSPRRNVMQKVSHDFKRAGLILEI